MKTSTHTMAKIPSLTSHLTTVFHQEPLLTGYSIEELAALFQCSGDTIRKALTSYQTECELDEIDELEGNFNLPIMTHSSEW